MSDHKQKLEEAISERVTRAIAEDASIPELLLVKERAETARQLYND